MKRFIELFVIVLITSMLCFETINAIIYLTLLGMIVLASAFGGRYRQGDANKKSW